MSWDLNKGSIPYIIVIKNYTQGTLIIFKFNNFYIIRSNSVICLISAADDIFMESNDRFHSVKCI